VEGIVQSGQGVLIFEADELIRELVSRWLRDAGYRVQIGSGSAEPDSATPRPALVIVDASNPRRSRSLVLGLQRRHRAPVLLISSRFRQGLGASLPAAQELGACRLLAKPFTQAELLASVAEAIGDS